VSDGYHRQRRFRLPDDATEVVLVRHGASAPVARGDLHELADDGRGDPPLAPEGEEEARAVAERLIAEPEPLRSLFVSGLRRTVQTAAPLVARLGIEPVEIRELREIHLGEWEGGEFRIRMREADELAMRAVTEERWDLIPGAEPMDEFAARVRRGVERVVELAGPGTTAAFVHGAVIGELCRQATDSRRFAFVHADNASLSRLVVFADGNWLLRAFNETTHLPVG
jgi:2,3-bisphosphoglycerate-dependent phosphoglycerate mutase